MSVTISNLQSLAQQVKAALGAQAAVSNAMEITSGLDAIGRQLAAFNSVRRQYLRSAKLEADHPVDAGGTAPPSEPAPQGLAALAAAVAALKNLTRTLPFMWTSQLDDFLIQAAQPGLLRDGLRKALQAYGLAPAEVDWLFGECDAVQFRLAGLLVDGNPNNLDTMLDGVGIGQHGILHGGFMTFTGRPDTDKGIAELVVRCRSKGVTASVVHTLVLAMGAGMAVHYWQHPAGTASNDFTRFFN